MEYTNFLLAKDKQYVNQVLSRSFPIVADSAKGSYLYSVEGIEYLDWTCGIGVTNIGHNHPKVIEAIKNQADKLLHTSVVTYNRPYIDLAEKLSTITPKGLDSFFFANSGAEVVDGAVKMARFVTGRPGIINFKGSFHGRTLLATALTTSKSQYRYKYEPLPGPIYTLTYPDDEEVNTTMEELHDLFHHQIKPDQVAAFIIEPVLGEGGYRAANYDFFEDLKSIANEYGILIIADEVQSGFGRTGRWFAVDHFNFVPDILLMAKGIAGGMPLGAFATTKDISSQWTPSSHGSTFGGNPISCAAAIANIEVIEEENLLAKAKDMGDFLQKGLYNITRDYCDFLITGLGLMIGLQYCSSGVKLIIDECFNNHLLLLSCGTYGEAVRLIPPLSLSREEAYKGLDIIEKAIIKSMEPILMTYEN